VKVKIIAVTNNKGGVGKSTTAGNVAAALSERGPTLIVDLDPQGNMSDFFGVRDRVGDRCVSRLLLGQATLRESVVSLDRPEDGLNRPRLFLLPASADLEEAGESLILADYQAARRPGSRAVPLKNCLSHWLASATDVFQYIVIDCPPKLDVLKAAVYHFAQALVVPTKPDHLSMVGVRQHTEDLERYRADGATARLRYILPTMVQPRQVMDRQMLIELISVYGRDRIAAPIPLAVAVKESSGSGGRTIFEYQPDHAAAKAYKHLAGRLA
jgi:chromosome partitioning protein